MKQILFSLALLAAVASPGLLFGGDNGGDGAYIPSYQELVREGYGSRHDTRDGYHRTSYVMRALPTQAYYSHGYTVFYGYTAVREHTAAGQSVYAFGYPADFYTRLMPEQNTNLDRLVVQLSRAGNYRVARAQPARGEAVSTVESTAGASGTTALSAVAEKPSR